MDKSVLVQYCEMVQEIKDIRRRIKKLDDFLAHPPIVSDTVKGTRKDGTIGPIRITGIPNPEYEKKEKSRERYRQLLEKKEAELLELTCQAEEYIDQIPKSEMRIMLRFSIIDGMTNAKIAQIMNRMFPRRRVPYTDENIKKRIQRFFKEVEKCPPMSP